MMKPKNLLALGAAFAVGVACAKLIDAPAPAVADTATPPGYLVVMGRGYEPGALAEYGKGLPPLYEKFGGSYLGIARDVEVFEGEYPYQSIVIAKWPSLQAARDFWTSPEYRELVKKREGIGEFDVVAFEGFPAPETVAPIARGE